MLYNTHIPTMSVNAVMIIFSVLMVESNIVIIFFITE